MFDFHPQTKGMVVDTFFFIFKAHLFSRAVGREGRSKDITLACARSASATLGLPMLMASVAALPCPHCSGASLLHWETSEAGCGLLAPPRSKTLRFRHSGSPQRRRLGWVCVLCPSQVPAAQVMRCLASAIVEPYRLPTAPLSRCTTSTPS